MALVLKDRVRESSVTSGTGTITLDGAVSGFQSFSVIGNSNTTYYCIADVTTGDWEVGVGTYTALGTTLSRDSVLESSNAGNLVNFSGNIKDVFCTYPAEQAVTLTDVQTLTNKTINGSSNTLSNVSLSTAVTGTLPVANGGTGATTLTANNVLLGNGTSTVQFVAPGTNGNVLTSNGTTWVSSPAAGGMVYPSAGVAVSTGSAWSASLTVPSGALVGTTATQTLTNKTINRAILNDGYTEEVFAITDGTTVNLDPNNGSIQTWTLGANRTPGQANWAAGQSITLMVDDGSAFTITWSTLGVVWETNGGTAPTLATSGFTVITLWKVGTTIYGARVGDA